MPVLTILADTAFAAFNVNVPAVSTAETSRFAASPNVSVIAPLEDMSLKSSSELPADMLLASMVKVLAVFIEEIVVVPLPCSVIVIAPPAESV